MLSSNKKSDIKTDVKEDNPDVKKPLAEGGVAVQPITYINVANDTHTVLVECDDNLKKFTFYTTSNQLIGSFNVRQLLKVVAPNLYPNQDMGLSKDVIHLYVYNDEGLVSHVDSYFMGNVDMIVKLFKYIKIVCNEDLMTVDDKATIQKIEKFMYLILHHILKLTFEVTNVTVKMNNMQEVTTSMVQYGVGAMYKITEYVRREVDSQKENIKLMQQELAQISESRALLHQRLDEIMGVGNIGNGQ